mgnify:FL=1|jgi:hypothetical protein
MKKKTGPKKRYQSDQKSYYIRNWKWPYNDENDPSYIKDKRELFERNQNGWFVYSGVKGIKIPKEYQSKNDWRNR